MLKIFYFYFYLIFVERIGFYFYYLQHYVEELILPGVLGVVVYLVREVYGSPENILMPFFSAYVNIWAFVYCERWSHKQVHNVLYFYETC